MKKLVLLLLLTFPLTLLAQHNDIYFVPKKEKKVLVEYTIENNDFAVEEENFFDEEESVDEMYYTNDLYDVYDDDYRYSTRIVRLRNPNRLIGSSIYWDLRYNCGISDWLIYDNGYTIDIYPTYNNPIYYWSYAGYAPYNRWWAWDRYHYPYNHWYGHHWYGHHPHHLHAGYYPPHFGGHLGRPGKKVHTDVPVNGGTNRRGTTVTTNNAKRENNVVPVNRRSNSTQTVRTQQSGASTTQRVRSSATVRSGQSGSQQRGTTTGVRTNQQRQTNSSVTRSGEGSSVRSRSTSSGSTNRSSGTSVSRTRSTSTTRSSSNVSSSPRSSSSRSSSSASYSSRSGSSSSRGSSGMSSSSRGSSSRR